MNIRRAVAHNTSIIVTLFGVIISASMYRFVSGSTVLTNVRTGDAQTVSLRSALYPENWTPGYTNSQGRFLQDFSYAGYHAGEKAIPSNPPGTLLDVSRPPYNADSTGTNDATLAVQMAIDAAAQAGGGVVYFPSGTYSVKPQSGKLSALAISKSNIVLRGESVDTTRIYLNENHMRGKSLIQVSPQSTPDWKSAAGVPVNYLSRDINTGARVIPLSTTPAFSVGDLVVLSHDDTSSWIEEHGMTAYWYQGAETPTYLRRVTAVNTSTKEITLDVPIRYYLKTRDRARVYKAGTHLREIGIENISFGMKESTKPGLGEQDYNLPGTAAYDLAGSNMIRMEHVENSWLRKIKSYRPTTNTRLDPWIGGNIHILSNGIELFQTRQVTVTESMLMNAQYRGGDGNGHFYQIEGNDNLISYSKGSFGRHNYSIKGAVSSGNVLLHNYSGKGWHMSDFHTKLSQGNLVDNQTMDGDGFEARNRYDHGSVGSRHGITSTQSVFWNSNGQKLYARRNLDGQIVDYIVHSDQHGYGYIIGTRGTYSKVYTPVTQQAQSPSDYTEAIGQGAQLNPQSLYLDQLTKRLNSVPATPSPSISPTATPTVAPTPSPTVLPSLTVSPSRSPSLPPCEKLNIFSITVPTGYTAVADCTNIGTTMYHNDPRFTFFNLPAGIRAMPFVKTGNLAEKSDRAYSIQLKPNFSGQLYLLYRKIPGQAVPVWIASAYTKVTPEGFENLNLFALRKNEEGLIGVYDIYKKNTPSISGTTVTLGAASDNTVTAFSMYIAVFKPE